MMSSVMCPTCQHKQLLPESEMGKLQSCPSCRSSFVAGKSVAQSRGAPFPPPSSPSQPPAFNKTMLADSSPPIKYNCPRCNAALEAPASQGGTKINCPQCTQRLQVPAASKAAPPPTPGLNKTMLANDDSTAPHAPPIKFNCPNCKRPLEAPANEGGTKKNCQYCSQRYQVPAASSLNKTKLATEDNGQWHQTGGSTASPPAPGGKTQPDAKGPNAVQLTPLNVGLALAVVLLLALVVPAVVNGGKRTDTEAAAKAQAELDKLKAEIMQKQQEVDRQKAAEAKEKDTLTKFMEEMRRQDERNRAQYLELVRTIADEKKKAEIEERFKKQQRDADEEKRETERRHQQTLEAMKQQAAETKRALEAAQQKQQTIIQQPPPVVYYPPYHYRYYHWW